jgi:hypothetical protein
MAYHDTVSALTPRHYWRMGASSGAETDLGSGAANLTVSGGTRDVASAGIGADDDGQITFDGVDDFASATLSLQSATTITIAGWITVGSYGTDDRMGLEYSANPNSNAGFSLDIGNSTGGETDTVSVSLTGAGGTGRRRVTFPRSALPAAEQHHLALVLGMSGSISVYIDGAAVSTTLRDGGNPGGTFEDTTLYLASRGGANLFCPVSWDELVVFTTGLSADSISALAIQTPAGAATLYVDKDNAGASDGGGRTQAQNPATPLASIQRAINLSITGDTIVIVKAETPYAEFIASTNETSATDVTIRGSIGGTGRPTIVRWTLVDCDTWTIQDVVTDGDSANPPRMYRSTDLTVYRWHARTGGAEILHWTGTIRLEDCDIEAPVDPDQPSQYMNGVGLRLGAQYTIDAFNADDFQFIRGSMTNVGGEDGFQLNFGNNSLNGEVLIDGAHFEGIKQGGVAHTDAIQSTGCRRLVVTNCDFTDVDSMIIASDDFIDELVIENNLFVGSTESGFSVQLSGIRNGRIGHNTWAQSRFGGIRRYIGNASGGTNEVDNPTWLVYNNVIDRLDVNDGVTLTSGQQFNNVIIVGPKTATDIDGYPEHGSSPDTAWELSNSPNVSPGINAGATVTGAPATDRLGRARIGAPDCGCHESNPAVLVTPYARAPYVIALTPESGSTGVDRGTDVTIELFPSPGETIDATSVTTSTFYVKGSNGTKLPAVATISAADGTGHQTLTLDINGSLYQFAGYTATASTGVEDTGGNGLASTQEWSFTIAGPSGAMIDTDIEVDSFTLAPDPRFPVGTVLQVWETTGDGRAKGPLVTSATVQADNRTTFTGLRMSTYYAAGPSLAGPFTFFRIYV